MIFHGGLGDKVILSSIFYHMAEDLQLRYVFRMGESNRFGGSCLVHGSSEGGAGPGAGLAGGLAGGLAAEDETLSPVPDPPPGFSHSACPPEVHKTCFCVRFIAEHTRMLEDSTKVGILYLCRSFHVLTKTYKQFIL